MDVEVKIGREIDNVVTIRQTQPREPRKGKSEEYLETYELGLNCISQVLRIVYGLCVDQMANE